MVKRSGYNFFTTRKKVKVLLLGEKAGKYRGVPREPYYDKSYFKQVFGKLRRKK
tara:strand:- start:32 stop:193 length:162 start_codon:yes stop_codon:yes gene_type:complete